MKVLICGKQTDRLIQEFDRYSGQHDNLYSRIQIQMKEMWELSRNKLSKFSVVIFVLESEEMIELAKKINRMNPMCQLIFVGEDYTILSRVYETKHTYFMLLDNVEKDFGLAMDCAVHHYEQECSKSLISFYCKGSKTFILPDEIDFAEIMGRNLFIHTIKGNIYETNCSLKKFCEKLPSWFLRTHNSYVVNKKQVTALEYPECILRSGQRIPVSRHYRREVCQEMGRI